MATISIKNVAQAIYESSYKKEGKELTAITEKIVDLISKKHLIGKSKDILIQLEKIIDKKEGIVRAKISSRTQIDKKVIDEIEDFIKKKYKANNTILEFEVDEKLLGGIKIQIGDEIIDTTLKNKIKKLQNYLIKN